MRWGDDQAIATLPGAQGHSVDAGLARHFADRQPAVFQGLSDVFAGFVLQGSFHGLDRITQAEIFRVRLQVRLLRDVAVRVLAKVMLEQRQRHHQRHDAVAVLADDGLHFLLVDRR